MTGLKKYSALPSLLGLFVVTTASALTSQTITVTTSAPSQAEINSNFTVYATASSGLYVSISGSGGCSGSGVGGAGITVGGATEDCIITYNQSGDASYNSAPQILSTTVVEKINQSISFPQPNSVMLGAAPFTITATASSGLPVSFSSSTPSICTVTSGGTVSAVASGKCTLNANQAGNSTYQAAVQESQTISINKTITSAQIKYLWIDGDTGTLRFSTTTAPPDIDACLSNYGYFVSNSIDVLALLVDAKINGSYVDITYAARSSTRSCDTAPFNVDDLLADVSVVSLSPTAPSTVLPAPITSASGSPFSRLTGIGLDWFWVDGNDGYVRMSLSSTLPADACGGFKFDGKTDVGHKIFLLMAAAKMENKPENPVPLTIWYPSHVGSCGAGDEAMINVKHVGLMY